MCVQHSERITNQRNGARRTTNQRNGTRRTTSQRNGTRRTTNQRNRARRTTNQRNGARRTTNQRNGARRTTNQRNGARAGQPIREIEHVGQPTRSSVVLKLRYNQHCFSFLRLMKECYEELALFYIAKTQRQKPEDVVEVAKSSGKVSPSKLNRVGSKLSRKEKESRERKQEEMMARRETKKELKAAWVAIRAAATITAVLKKRALLVGDVTELSISKETGVKIPESAVHDMLGAVSMILNTKDDSCLQEDGVITMDSYINGSNDVRLTWVHLLSHVSYLQRQISYQSLGVKTAGHGAPLFRWRKLLKLCQMRHLLKTELNIYAESCLGVYPSPLLMLTDVSGKKSDYDLNNTGISCCDFGVVSVVVVVVDVSVVVVLLLLLLMMLVLLLLCCCCGDVVVSCVVDVGGGCGVTVMLLLLAMLLVVVVLR